MRRALPAPTRVRSARVRGIMSPRCVSTVSPLVVHRGRLHVWTYRARAASAVRHRGAVPTPVRAAGPGMRPPQGAALVPPAVRSLPTVRAPHAQNMRVRALDTASCTLQSPGRALRTAVPRAADVPAAPLPGYLPRARRVCAVQPAVRPAARLVWPRVHQAVPCAGAMR